MLLMIIEVSEEEINLPNGMTIKIEYWLAEELYGTMGRFNANYRKIILVDENNKIISEVFEPNPQFIHLEDHERRDIPYEEDTLF